MDYAPDSIVMKADIIPIVVAFMSWPALMIFRHLPSPAADLVNREIRNRIAFYLAVFVGDDHVWAFIERLRLAKGVVVGSIVRQILTHMLSPTQSITPYDLNIIVGDDKQWPLCDFICSKSGYTHGRAKIGRHYRDTINGVERLEKRAAFGQVRFTSPCMVVYLMYHICLGAQNINFCGIAVCH